MLYLDSCVDDSDYYPTLLYVITRRNKNNQDYGMKTLSNFNAISTTWRGPIKPFNTGVYSKFFSRLSEWLQDVFTKYKTSLTCSKWH